MIVPCNHDGIVSAFRIVRKGGIVVFPTDTVYGIGCNPFNEEAVKRIYRIKGRKETKQLPVLGFSIFEISKVAAFNELARRLSSKFWPGPLTLILPVRDERISKSLGLGKKIAVRMPDNPCVLGLLEKCKLLVGTSANRSGHSPAGDASEIISSLEGYDILLDGGRITNPVESTIVEVLEDKIHVVRKGKITEKELTAQL